MGDGRLYGPRDALTRPPQMNRLAGHAAAAVRARQLAACPSVPCPSMGQGGLEMHLGLFLVKWPFRFQRWSIGRTQGKGLVL